MIKELIEDFIKEKLKRPIRIIKVMIFLQALQTAMIVLILIYTFIILQLTRGG